VTGGLKKLNVKPQLQVSTETLLEMWNTVTCKPNSNFGAGYVVEKEALSTRRVREEGISGDEFEQLVLMQLGMYIERSASKALAADTNSDSVSKTTLLVLKFLLAQTNVKGKAGVNHGEEPDKAEAPAYGPDLPPPHLPYRALKGEVVRESGEAGLEEKVDILMVQQAEVMQMLVMLMDQREQERMREKEERELVLLLAERDKEREQQHKSAVQHHLKSALTSPITSPSPSRPQVPRPSPRDKEGGAGGYDLEVSLQNLLPSPRESKELSLEQRRHQAEGGGASSGRSQVAGARVVRGEEMAGDWADEGAKGVRERELRREGRGEEKRAGERDRERELEKELDRYREREKEWERERQWQRERKREQREGERERERVSLALSPASASSARDGERDREHELEKELERYRERDREWERERERETGRRNGGDMSGDRSSGRLGPQGMAEKGELQERERERDQDVDIAREGERRREWERQRGKDGLDAPSLSQGEHVKWDKQRTIVPPLW
jgi:hypothetical protein